MGAYITGASLFTCITGFPNPAVTLVRPLRTRLRASRHRRLCHSCWPSLTSRLQLTIRLALVGTLKTARSVQVNNEKRNPE